MTKRLPVIAAIPAYNAEATLAALLNDVLEQKYNGVVVMDDASTDHTVELSRQFAPDVQTIRGAENLGTGANRNRIIPVLGDKALSLIHFLDADVRLNTDDMPEAIRDIGRLSNLGVAGGLVRDADGQQNPWNYGPPYSIWAEASGAIELLVHKIGENSPRAGAAARQVLNFCLSDWPNIYQEPLIRSIGWPAEANIVVQSELFAKMGGFDPRYRYAEIHDFTKRLKRLGKHVIFDPSIDVTHTGHDKAGKDGNEWIKARLIAARQFRQQYGWGQYLLGERLAEKLDLVKEG